jgi:UDP-glucose 4-epimerase
MNKKGSFSMNTLKGKSILVTGGAGFIGSHLVDELIDEKPEKLVVVDNLFLGDERNLNEARQKFPALIFKELDASDKDSMKILCDKHGVEVIFNLAVIPLPTSLARPKWTTDQNILITSTLCELAKEKAFQTLIHFSSSEAYGSAQTIPMDENHALSPLTPYAASKAAGDHIVLSFCESFLIDAAILRPFNNFGPRQNDKAYAGIIPIVIKNVLHGKPIEIFGDGQQTRDFIFVKDTAKAAIGIYKCPDTRSQITNIASGRETSINELVEEMLRIMKAEKHTVVHSEPRPGDVRRHCADVSKARRYFDFTPTKDIQKGLRVTINWYSNKQQSKTL